MITKCKHCGKEFEANDRRIAYCSDECRETVRMEIQRKYRKLHSNPLCEIVCPICNKTFMPKTRNQVVCSCDCREIYNKEQQRVRSRKYNAKQRLEEEKEKLAMTKPTFKSKGIAYDTLTPEQKFFYGRTQEKAYADELRVIIPRGLTKVKYRDA